MILYEDQDTKLAITDNMRTYGGGFVKALAECILRADKGNFYKLQDSFGEYFEEYHPINWRKPITQIKLGFVYQNSDGEYFETVLKENKIVLQNPSYPFVFLPEVQQPLKEIGKADEFRHLIKEYKHEFIEGDSLTVEVKNDGHLKVVKND